MFEECAPQLIFFKPIASSNPVATFIIFQVDI